MNEKPLQYSSLKSVILFLEPSFRLHLSCRLPSIRTAEKGTPLKIDILRFEDNTIIVNDTEYQLSVYRKYHVERPPIEVSGTVLHDFDEYGFKIRVINDLLLGDVRISTPPEIRVIDSDSEKWRNFINRQIVVYERKLQHLRDTQSDLGDYEERLDELRRQLLPFEYRQNQQKPPFDLYYQLTIRNESTIQRTYHIPYTAKLHNGMKKLMEMLFGKRQDVWKVDYMHLDCPILRWPMSGVLPFVRKLRIGNLKSTNMEALKSIIHSSSFPLNTLEISLIYFGDFGQLNGGFDDKTVAEAQHLTLNQFYPSKHQLVRIRNSNVFINTRIHPIEFRNLISHWLRYGRPIDTCFTFDFHDFEPNECFEKIRNFRRVMERSERHVKLSMRNSLVLVVSKNERIVVENGDHKKYWTVELKVVPED